MSVQYREYRYWSPVLGCKAARLSMADERGGEYFAILPVPDRGWRQARDDALVRIADAIGEQPPGEVLIG